MAPDIPSLDTVYDQIAMRSSALGDAALVEELRDLLGSRLVAYLAGASSTATVSAYVNGAVPVPAEAHGHLRLAYNVAAVQQQLGASPRLIQAWFQGSNPRLGDRAPARAILEDPTAATHHVLIAAAATLTT
ncbi:MAG: hypothetical protein WBA98_03070 [Gordonia sp. (in: high G+C Gram-positive bacteria)]|uniref:hypothetical protein n=1 Tax=Gordonia sp. (in: high G+C Gram-positive bacteria) TaxID=84139 RepID=UPI003C7652FF